MKQEKRNILRSSLFVALFFIVIAVSVTFLTSGRVNDKELNKQTTISAEQDGDCKFGDLILYGKVQFVTSFPDLKVQVVESFPDLKVKIVESFPDKCGEWQIVSSFPDLKVQIVESFPDIKIKFVESFPGIP